MEYSKALITGATSGVGEKLAYLLHEKNISLLLTGRNKKKLEVLKKKLGAQILVADLSQEKGRQEVSKWMKKQLPDLLVNNAGFGFYGSVAGLSLEDQKEIVDVNLQAVFELTQQMAATWVKKKKTGVVLNISSIAGEYPIPGLSVYAASKAFVTSFSESMDFEIKKQGVRVLVNCPGQIATQFAKRAGGKKVTQKRRLAMTPEYVASRVWKQLTCLKQKDVYPFFQKIALRCVPKKLLFQSMWNEITNRL